MHNVRPNDAPLMEWLQQSMQQFSSDFNNLTLLLVEQKSTTEVQTLLQQTFHRLLRFFQTLSAHLQQAEKDVNQLKQQAENLQEENRRLDLLITAGLGLSGNIHHKKQLMANVLDTLATVLNTDSSYILLLDGNGNVSMTLGRNIDSQREQEVQDWSRTVIQQALEGNEPHAVTLGEQDDRSLSQSMVRLQIKSAMCVPICIDRHCLGVVYVDRRRTDQPFTSGELAFLMKFSSFIAHALQVSQFVEKLQTRIVNKLVLNRKELNEVFQADNLVGHSRALLDVLRIAAQVAPTDVPVLITGESGTGKELIARAIHQNSLRRDEPFVTINCGAIPENLLESELFGYQAGAFTGAKKAKPGKIALAHRGTLFLDEIGELHPSLQAKLLRVLQFGEVEPLGGTQPQHIDVRIIAATNRNLSDMIQQGHFREDLFYRLRVIELHMPSLRERREDIPELVDYFIRKHGKQGETITIDEAALSILENYNWPGNIRELENVIQRALILCRDGKIRVDDLPGEIRTTAMDTLVSSDEKTLAEAERDFRRLYITKILRNSKTKAEAARRLGVNRSYLYKLMEELGLQA